MVNRGKSTSPIDERISQLSGQVFSHAYRDTLGNTEMVLNSLLPISAILVAERMGKRDVYLLKALQEAYYLDGLNISDKDTLLFIVKNLALMLNNLHPYYLKLVKHKFNNI